MYIYIYTPTYVMTPKFHQTRHISEPEISTKGFYISAKGFYISAKEPYISAKEPYISAKATMKVS